MKCARRSAAARAVDARRRRSEALRHPYPLFGPVYDQAMARVLERDDVRGLRELAAMGNDITCFRHRDRLTSTLIAAAELDAVCCAAALLAKGVSVRARDDLGNTACERAAFADHARFCALLLPRIGTDSLAAVRALRLAVSGGHLATIAVLQGAGVDMRSARERGARFASPWTIALEHMRVPVLEALLRGEPRPVAPLREEEIGFLLLAADRGFTFALGEELRTRGLEGRLREAFISTSDHLPDAAGEKLPGHAPSPVAQYLRLLDVQRAAAVTLQRGLPERTEVVGDLGHELEADLA